MVLQITSQPLAHSTSRMLAVSMLHSLAMAVSALIC
jgi:hypothetical protein